MNYRIEICNRLCKYNVDELVNIEQDFSRFYSDDSDLRYYFSGIITSYVQMYLEKRISEEKCVEKIVNLIALSVDIKAGLKKLIEKY